MTALRRTLNLARPDDVYNAIVDAHKDLTDEQCRDFDARLILLLVNHIGDEAVIREAWKEAGHQREPRVSVSRSIFALVDDRDRAYFGHETRDQDQIGYIDAKTRAIFGRSYAAEPDVLVKQLAQDEAIAAADTLLLTVPNQLGVDYNVHAIKSILKYVAPDLGWR